VVVAGGTVPAPAVAPRAKGRVRLPLPRDWQKAHALHVTARGPAGEGLWTWSAQTEGGWAPGRLAAGTAGEVAMREGVDTLTVAGPAGELRFDRATGRLLEWRRGDHLVPLGQGPLARAFVRTDRTHAPVEDAARLVSLTPRRQGRDLVIDARYEGVLKRASWRFARGSDAVVFDYELEYGGAIDVLGVGFDLPSGSLAAKRWVGRGPYRVYRNRLDGGIFNLHEVAWNDPVPGQSFTYPEFKGYFREWRWLDLETGAGTLSVENLSGVPFFGLDAPRDGEPAMLAFPDTGLAFLDVIPAQRNKFDPPETLGPQSKTPGGVGLRQGSVSLRFSVPVKAP
jgi:hypothetical protein